MGHVKLHIPGPVEVSEKTFRAFCTPMIGHRGQGFKDLYARIQPQLQQLLYTQQLVYISTSSAWGVMEGAIRNLVAKKVLNCMCGAFSDKWFDVSKRCGKEAEALQVPWGSPIRAEAVAQKLATGFYRHFAKGISGPPVVSRTDLTTYQDVPTFYTFTFSTGGFVIMAADDASIPVLGYSFDSPMPEEITNPATKEWLESYSHEIWQIVQHHLDNTETLKEWNAMRRGEYAPSTRDVNPLLTTTWDQGCFYNALCPADAGATSDNGRVNSRMVWPDPSPRSTRPELSSTIMSFSL